MWKVERSTSGTLSPRKHKHRAAQLNGVYYAKPCGFNLPASFKSKPRASLCFQSLWLGVLVELWWEVHPSGKQLWNPPNESQHSERSRVTSAPAGRQSIPCRVEPSHHPVLQGEECGLRCSESITSEESFCQQWDNPGDLMEAQIQGLQWKSWARKSCAAEWAHLVHNHSYSFSVLI